MFFWLIVSEVSVHGGLTPLLLGLWQGIMEKGMGEETCSPYDSQETESERKGLGTSYTF
jgi:hypothetical protein